MDNRAFALI